MWKRHVISILALGALVFLAFGSGKSETSIEEEVKKASSEKPAEGKPALTVSAAQLFKDYEENEVAADEKYKGKILQVSGEVSDIGKDIMDKMYVNLKTENMFMHVQCYFSDKHKDKLKTMKKGQQVTIKGKCDGKLMGVNLRGCLLVE
ncbi:MAG: OB-fold protein [Planctomycetota bacterium]